MRLNHWPTKDAIIASILSGLLLFLGWPNEPLTLALLVAWVPLLWLDHTKGEGFPLLRYVALALLIWNAGTTWWLWNSTGFGAIAAIVINTLLMCIPWWGYLKIKRHFPDWLSHLGLIGFWMCFEWVHLNWSVSWPWLTLGNGLSSMTPYIQWYEYTGVAGGSLLIWLLNLLVFYGIVAWQKTAKKLAYQLGFAIVAILLSVGFISQQLTPTNLPQNTKANIVVVQPNIDPYQKFESLSTADQINQLLRITNQYIDSQTQMVIWPETAMSAADWQDNIPFNPSYQPIFSFLAAHPSIQIISGIETFKRYGASPATNTARQTPEGLYYDAFNAAVSLQSGKPLVFYNKSKLVPGVETLPSFLKFMAPVFEQFGGSTGGYGISDTAVVFRYSNATIPTAPIICYESIYGDYITNYVKRGAQILTIMTNDGWWGNTPGHHQHLQYARLRAIETRRWVARSANTGISAFIQPDGQIAAQLGWNKTGALKMAIPTNQSISFYVQFGDWLYKIMIWFTGLLIVVYGYKKFSHAKRP